MKIIYMGTPDFAVPCLKRLVEEKYDVVCVVTQPDKPQGRKQILTPSDVKVAATELGLNIYQPKTLRSEEAYEYLKQFEADYIVVAAYGKILPENVLKLPKYACVNVHGSLLPKYRGAAPIQRSVLAGDKVTGITTMLMDVGLDTGDILEQKKLEIGIDDTAGEVFDKLASISPDLLIHTLEKFAKGEITPTKQEDAQSNYAAMLTKEEAEIDWCQPSIKIHNTIRGMSPWPVAYTFYNGKKLKLYSSSLSDETTSLDAGEVKKDKNSFLVSCGDKKLITINELQLEGAKRVDAKAFLAGHPVTDKLILGK